MTAPKSQTTFSVEITEDGSPTLRLPQNGESMHHSGGAATETNYIYRAVIAGALKKLPTAKVGVVGLGLGYIEVCWAMEVIKQGLRQSGSLCRSFEVDRGLIDNFMSWINGHSVPIYDQVCRCLDDSIAVAEIKEVLRRNFASDGVYVDLLNYRQHPDRYHVICYDAFSRKTSDPLWTADFLTAFISESCESDAVFTTYAATVNLKTALKANEFTLHNRTGFKGKRESTLAGRGIFSSFDFYRTS